MEIKVENEEYRLYKNCFITDEDLYLGGWYGLTYFELHQRYPGCDYSTSITLDEKSFNRLYDMMTEMKKLLED